MFMISPNVGLLSLNPDFYTKLIYFRSKNVHAQKLGTYQIKTLVNEQNYIAYPIIVGTFRAIFVYIQKSKN